MRVRQNEELETVLTVFGWFKRMWIKKLPLSRRPLKEKAITYAQELKAEEFHASNGWFESWKVRFNVPFEAIAGEKMQ